MAKSLTLREMLTACGFDIEEVLDTQLGAANNTINKVIDARIQDHSLVVEATLPFSRAPFNRSSAGEIG